MSSFKKIQFHALAIALAIILSMCIVDVFFEFYGKQNFKTKLITGNQTLSRGTQANYENGIQAEVEWISALKNKENIILLGSSELGTFPRSSYLELPDSLNIPCIGFGHAFHQSFSMACQALAGREYLKDAKICVIFSPGWLETEGTNVEAFLEFVPTNFLRKILHDDKISNTFKNKIGEYIYRNDDLIENPNQVLKLYKNAYLKKDIPFLKEKFEQFKNNISSVSYKVKPLVPKLSKKSLPLDYKKQMQSTKDKFIKSVKTNKIFVSDEYFTEYVLDKKTGKIVNGNVSKMDYLKSQEMKDFLMLIQILKYYQADVSIIIQPLNNYHYSGIENLNPAIQSIEKELKSKKIPYLNLFAYSKAQFEPAVLNDIMHLGNYGWMKVNHFLVEKYAQ